MSIRAHLIKKIEYGGCFWNAWHDKEFMRLLEINGYLEGLDYDGVGLVEIDKECVEETNKGYKELLKRGEITKEVKKMYQRVVEITDDLLDEFEKQGVEYLQFMFY